MKQTVTFRSRPEADALKQAIKEAAPAAYTSVYFLHGRYAVTVSGDVPDDIITRCRK